MDIWCSTVVDIGTQTNHSTTSFDTKSNITIENIEYSFTLSQYISTDPHLYIKSLLKVRESESLHSSSSHVKWTFDLPGQQ